MLPNFSNNRFVHLVRSKLFTGILLHIPSNPSRLILSISIYKYAQSVHSSVTPSILRSHRSPRNNKLNSKEGGGGWVSESLFLVLVRAGRLAGAIRRREGRTLIRRNSWRTVLTASLPSRLGGSSLSSSSSSSSFSISVPSRLSSRFPVGERQDRMKMYEGDIYGMGEGQKGSR